MGDHFKDLPISHIFASPLVRLSLPTPHHFGLEKSRSKLIFAFPSPFHCQIRARHTAEQIQQQNLTVPRPKITFSPLFQEQLVLVLRLLSSQTSESLTVLVTSTVGSGETTKVFPYSVGRSSTLTLVISGFPEANRSTMSLLELKSEQQLPLLLSYSFRHQGSTLINCFIVVLQSRRPVPAPLHPRDRLLDGTATHPRSRPWDLQPRIDRSSDASESKWSWYRMAEHWFFE